MADRFSDVLGARRGGDPVTIAEALAGLADGRAQPALRALLDARDFEEVGELVERLADRLAADLSSEEERSCTAALARLNALRYTPDGQVPLWDDELMRAAARNRLVERLRLITGDHRADPTDVLSGCRAEVRRLAAERVSAYLRRGGAQYLRRMFGHQAWHSMRKQLADRTGIHPHSPNLATLLTEAVSADWALEVVSGKHAEHPDGELKAIGARLVDIAAERQSTG